jgi:hypothetical protein
MVRKIVPDAAGQDAAGEGVGLGNARIDGNAAICVAGDIEAWMALQARVNGREPVEVTDRILRDSARMANDPHKTRVGFDVKDAAQLVAHQAE